jgi:hypothetical protein
MRIDADLKNLVLAVAVAVLIPMTVKYGITAFSKTPASANHTQKVFYAKTGLGVACLFAGAKMTPPVMGAGVFVGGLVLLIKGVRGYWPNMNHMSHFLLLLFALAVVVWLVQRKHGSIGGLRKAAGRGRKK